MINANINSTHYIVFNTIVTLCIFIHNIKFIRKYRPNLYLNVLDYIYE